jgi:hypothetical protein
MTYYFILFNLHKFTNYNILTYFLIDFVYLKVLILNQSLRHNINFLVNFYKTQMQSKLNNKVLKVQKKLSKHIVNNFL